MDLREIAEKVFDDVMSSQHLSEEPDVVAITIIESALRSVAPQWQPIEAAPKDGRWILAWDLKHQWRDRPPVVAVRAKRPQSMWQDKDDTSYGNLTHYMPLPLPPKGEVR